MRPAEDPESGPSPARLPEGAAAAVTAGPETIVVRLRAPLSPADCAQVCEQVRALLADGTRRTVLCDVDVAADLRVVDALLRLQLTATRARSRLRLRDAPADVHRLLSLTGLSAVVCELEPVGHAEAGEQGGVEEVVQVDDLAP